MDCTRGNKKIWEPGLLYDSVYSWDELDPCSSCLYLSNAGITGMSQHAHCRVFTLFQNAFFYINLFCVGACVPLHACGGHTTQWGRFSPSTLQALEIGRRTSGLVVSTCWAIFTAKSCCFLFLTCIIEHIFSYRSEIYKSKTTKPAYYFFLILAVFYPAHSCWLHITLEKLFLWFAWPSWNNLQLQPRKSKDFVETAQIHTDVVLNADNRA